MYIVWYIQYHSSVISMPCPLNTPYIEEIHHNKVLPYAVAIWRLHLPHPWEIGSVIAKRITITAIDTCLDQERSCLHLNRRRIKRSVLLRDVR